MDLINMNIENSDDTTKSVVKQLKSLPGIPTEIDSNITDEEIEQALIRHCKRSKEQAEEVFGKDFFETNR